MIPVVKSEATAFQPYIIKISLIPPIKAFRLGEMALAAEPVARQHFTTEKDPISKKLSGFKSVSKAFFSRKCPIFFYSSAVWKTVYLFCVKQCTSVYFLRKSAEEERK